MKKVFMSIVMFLLISPVFAIEFNVDLSYQSSYNWRGLKINDSPVFQPSFSITNKNITFEVWGNMDISNSNERKYDFNELDYSLSYDKDFNKYGVSLGFIYYDFPGSEDESTYEVFAGVSFYTFLNPTIMFYKDLDLNEGTYIQLAISHTFEILPKEYSNGLDLTVSTGYGDSTYKKGYFQFGMGNSQMREPHHHGESTYSSGLLDLGVRLDLPINLKKGALNFNISYYNLADSEIHSPGYETDDSEVVYGFGYSLSF